MLGRTMHVAFREFSATVLTKAFLLGVLLAPVLGGIGAGAAVLMKYLPAPRVSGTVAVIDRSGLAADCVAARFSPEAVARELKREQEETGEAVDKAAGTVGIDKSQTSQAKEMAAAEVGKQSRADLTVETLASDADAEKAKAPLKAADGKSGQRAGEGVPPPRLLLAVIPEGAVKPAADGSYAGFEVYVAPNLDFEIQARIVRRIGDGIVDARVATNAGARAGGLSAEEIRTLIRRPEAQAKTMTARGEKQNAGVGALFVPMGFMALLLMSVLVGGQGLLASTIEEKSSRVMEVLLSAVSPLQLMVGKILGQMAAALIMLVMYGGLAMVALIVFSLGYLVSPMNLVFLVIYFLLAFFLVAALMAAIGSAVTELREAQTLQTPIIMLVILPWLLVMPISRAPNSLFATVMSFVPGLNPFVMMIRLGGSEPVPAWQIPASIAVGLLSAAFAAWAAAKVFRIGVLMYGKPPNLRTLIKWVRMA